jgi:hypothetical protein
VKERPLPQIVVLATGLALVPLLAGLVSIVVPELLPIGSAIVERAVIGYAALLLGFSGGVRWGIRLAGGGGTDRIYVLGVLGMILGLVALLMPFALALAMLTVGFAGQGAWDVWAGFNRTVPEPYARQRTMTTLAACLLLMAILLAHAAMQR